MRMVDVSTHDGARSICGHRLRGPRWRKRTKLHTQTTCFRQTPPPNATKSKSVSLHRGGRTCKRSPGKTYQSEPCPSSASFVSRPAYPDWPHPLRLAPNPTIPPTARPRNVANITPAYDPPGPPAFEAFAWRTSKLSLAPPALPSSGACAVGGVESARGGRTYGETSDSKPPSPIAETPKM